MTAMQGTDDPAAGGTQPQRRVRVLIADDEEEFRQSLTHRIGQSERIELVGAVNDGRSAVQHVTTHGGVDVVMMDINMPNMNGFDATAEIRRHAPSVRVLVMTAMDGVDTRVRAMGVGAAGVLLKLTGQAALVEAIIAVDAGIRLYSDPPADGMSQVDFTTREWEVFSELCAGRPTKEISARLHVAESTVKTHVTAVMRKLQVHRRSAVPARAVELGLILPTRTPQ